MIDRTPIVAVVSGAGERPEAGRGQVRLDWLDGTKGIAILWIVFFHFFVTYEDGRLPWLLVLYFGARMRSLDTAVFVVGAGVIIAILVLAAMLLERGVNALTSGVLG